MSAITRIAKNTVVMIIGDVGAKILTLGYTILLARYLQVEGFGVLSFILAITGMVGILTNIGFFELTVREVARDRSLSKKFLSNIVLLKTLILISVFGIFFILIAFSEYPREVRILAYLIGSAVIVDSLGMVLRPIFQAYEKMEYLSFGKILRSGVLFAGVVPITLLGYGLTEFGMLYLLANVVSTIYLFYAVRREVGKFIPKIELKFWKWILKAGFPFLATTAFVVILNDTDKIMLSLMVGNEAVGYYSAAYRIVFALNFLPAMFISAIYPITSRLFEKSRDSLEDVNERAFKYVLFTGVLLLIFLSFFSEQIILFVFGDGYMPSARALKILAWSQFFLYLNIVHGNLFKSINMQSVKAYQSFFAASLNVALNLIMIPYWSFVGASVATFFSRFLSFLYLTVMAKRRFHFTGKLILNTFHISAIVLTFNLIHYATGNILTVIPLAAIILIYTYKMVLDKTDIQILRSLLKSSSKLKR